MEINAQNLFYVIIGIIVINFIKDSFLDYLNSKYFDKKPPKNLENLFEKEKYLKSQEYKKTKYNFSRISSLFGVSIVLLFFFFDGFLILDEFCRSNFDSELIISLSFFGLIFLLNDLANLPFSLYNTFVIEEKFGFNKTTIKTFIFDKIKSWIITIIFGGGILSFIIFQFETIGKDFWLIAWLFVSLLTILINGFYAQIIVPLFNKQTKLKNGDLKNEIKSYSKKVGFDLKNIFVIDGSKRSTKANAYFSGFGAQKRITLYDTLINDLETDEIVAVLAHEVGHYKRKHIIVNLFSSILLTGFTFWLLSIFVSLPIFSEALNITTPSFHVGLIVFGILYSPISEFTGLLMNILSRKFEFQADNYAKETFAAQPLITSLKKLSKNSLSNLTPHPAYIFMNYSHPTLLQRVQNLNK